MGDDSRGKIKEIYLKNHGSWPEELWTGVMFYKGERITVQDFDELYLTLLGLKEDK